MKIELVEETKLGDNTWWSVYVDGKFVTGSYSIIKADSVYEEIKKNRTWSQKIVLKSEEIDVFS